MKATHLDFYYGFTGWDHRGEPAFGLIPFPDHMQPRDSPSRTASAPAAQIAGSDGTVLVTLDPSDRQSLVLAIERLMALMDEIDGDLDFEVEQLEEQHDAEVEDAEPNGDEHDYGRCEDDALAGELYSLTFGPLEGGQGL